MTKLLHSCTSARCESTERTAKDCVKIRYRIGIFENLHDLPEIQTILMSGRRITGTLAEHIPELKGKTGSTDGVLRCSIPDDWARNTDHPPKFNELFNGNLFIILASYLFDLKVMVFPLVGA